MRWLSILLLSLVTAFAQNAYVGTLRVGTLTLPCQNCPPRYPQGTLGYELTTNISILTTNTAKAWVYFPDFSDLGYNTNVWTWPVNLSCVGYASDGYQSVLLTRNKLLSCRHFGGES